MVTVMATGVFDLLHPGHLYFLEKARELGDELVVVIARDSTVRRQKHEPITPEEMRRAMVESLKPVDRAILGTEGDMYDIVEKVKPDIIAIGYDQPFETGKIEEELGKRGLNVTVKRLPYQDGDLDGTRKIVRKIVDLWSFTERMKRIEGDKKKLARKDKKKG
jgi:FAD synthetase